MARETASDSLPPPEGASSAPLPLSSCSDCSSPPASSGACSFCVSVSLSGPHTQTDCFAGGAPLSRGGGDRKKRSRPETSSLRVRMEARFMQGRRPKQEDRHVLVSDMSMLVEDQDKAAIQALDCSPAALVALFDGHCGATCSEFCATHLPSRVTSYLVKPLPKSKRQKLSHQPPAAPSSESAPSSASSTSVAPPSSSTSAVSTSSAPASPASEFLLKLPSSLQSSLVCPFPLPSEQVGELFLTLGPRIISAFKHVDREFLSKFRTLKVGGCTAVVCLILGNFVVVASVGDSRAVAGVCHKTRQAQDTPCPSPFLLNDEIENLPEGTSEKEEDGATSDGAHAQSLASASPPSSSSCSSRGLTDLHVRQMKPRGGQEERSQVTQREEGDECVWQAIRVSRDHRPNLPEERERIEANGGRVVEVGGVARVAPKGFEERAKQIKMEQCISGGASKPPPVLMAVSRGFGDKELKEENLISATPDVFCFHATENVRLLIIACDGVWDVMTDQEAVEIAARHLDDPKEAASQVVKRAFERGSQDNLTAIALVFDH
ncbi:UNVERIFIED_CONTAM: protein phosphatase 2C domain-containing protein [Hammondia hammondi]|eukprot:XP_008887980.1 protein phosphatase 2C domain-containing protein [Hammondia hammondi]